MIMCKQISLSLLFSIFFTPCIGMYKAIIAQLDDDSDSDKIALYDLSEELLKEYKELIQTHKTVISNTYDRNMSSLQEKIDNLLSSKDGFSISAEEKQALQKEQLPINECETKSYLTYNNPSEKQNNPSEKQKEESEKVRKTIIHENELMKQRISQLNDLSQGLQKDSDLSLLDLNSILQNITTVRKKCHTTKYKTLLNIIHRALFYQKNYAHYAAPVTTTVSLPTKKFQWTFAEEGKETWEEEHHAWIEFLNEQSELIGKNQSLVKKFTPIECRGILEEILTIQEHYKNPTKYETLQKIIIGEIQREAQQQLKILEQEAAARSK